MDDWQRLTAIPGALFTLVDGDDLLDRQKARPLTGGVNLNPKGEINVGTLGVFCRVKNDPTDSKIFALTCLHNIVPDYLPTDPPTRWLGVKVGQPTGKDSCCKSSSKIFGRVFNANPDLDIALVRVDAGQQYLREIAEIGPVKAAHALTKAETDVVPFLVKKRGARSGLTGGWIAVHSQPLDLKVRKTTVHFADVHIVKPNDIPRHPEGGIFADEGDSGSAVLDDNNHVVGIAVARRFEKVPDSGTPGGIKIVNFVAAIPIQQIFDAFEKHGDPTLRVPLEIAVAQQPGQVFTVPQSPYEMLEQPAPAWDEGVEPRDIEEDARRTRLGGWYADLYYRHRDEIEGLVNDNRHVAAVWHRRGGAALMHAFGRVLRVRDARVPETLEGIPLGDCVAGFSRTLDRFGSAPLRRDLRAVTPTLPELGGLCYDEIIDTLARADRSLGGAHG